MATFPDYNPVFSANKSDITNTRTVQFGDGYQQRFTFGINQKAKQWSLTFNVDNEDATEIETFLEARKVDAKFRVRHYKKPGHGCDGVK